MLSIVPQPRFVRMEAGSYAWPRVARIAASSLTERRAAEPLRAYLASVRVRSSFAERVARAGVAVELAPRADSRLGAEGYELRVRGDGVTMRAKTAAGLFYALQTLEQISSRNPDGLHSAAVTIVDRPEYRWRGIHLDVARHFFAARVVERYVDVAAHYKLNVFHWHLTDDQAWRLPSTRYPALTGGGEAYSASDVREVIAYAAARHVTVVPEIDLPGHASAALRAYPRLACEAGTLCTSGEGLRFARTVLDEAIATFPSPVIHAGGDEVAFPASRSQPPFTRALEREAASHGRRLAGWDEIAAPGISPRTIVTVWRGGQRAAAIARLGNDVVLASAPLYFDAAQGDPAQEPPASRHMATLEQVYSDGAAPLARNSAAARHVVGVQGNLWTEHVPTEEHLFSMLLPRELALAEVAWTPRERKSWHGFVARLPQQLAWLDAHGYSFRIPNVAFAFSGGGARFDAVPAQVQAVRVSTTAPRLTMTLSVPLANATIRYTTDGSTPSPASPRYRAPFAVRATSAPLRVRAAAFLRDRRGAVTESLIVRVPPSALGAHRGGSSSWSSLVSP
jgi:hexosaminidase